MKSKEEIYRDAHNDAPFPPIHPDKYDLLAMDEYAKSIAKEAIEDIERRIDKFTMPLANYETNQIRGLEIAVNLIKHKFNIL